MVPNCFTPLHMFLLKMAPVPESEWTTFATSLQMSRLSPGKTLVRVGEHSDTVSYIVSGLTKASYLTLRGHEFICSFESENSLIGPYVSILSDGAPSQVTITALEPCTLIASQHRHFRQALTRHWTWQQIGRIIAERSYVIRERRQHELLTLSAEQRLAAFLAQYPGLAARISQKDLAAYLGINFASLSRLRAKTKK